jgi:hypothetical protein
VQSKASVFAFPIYFIRKGNDPKQLLDPSTADFNGGVNIGWRQGGGKERTVFAEFFIGSVFKLPGLP